MDPLISTGVAAPYMWSLYALFFGSAGRSGTRTGFTWLASAIGADATYPGVTALVLLGRYIEARAIARGLNPHRG